MIRPTNYDTYDAVERALALCKGKDRELPHEMRDALDLTAFIDQHKAGPYTPAVDDLAAQVFAAAPAERDQVLTEVSTEWARRAFMDAVVRRPGLVPSGVRTRAHLEALPELHRRLRPVFDAAAGRLTEAAAVLPAGSAAVDLEAIVTADAGSAFKAAREATDCLLTVTRAFPRVKGTRSDSARFPLGAQVVLVATIPTTTVTRLDALHMSPLNDPGEQERNASVKDLVRAYGEDPHLALLDIARGRWDGVALDLAEPGALAERVQNIESAHLMKRARESVA